MSQSPHHPGHLLIPSGSLPLVERPAVKWPGTFGDFQLFITYPYLLPCGLAALVTFAGKQPWWLNVPITKFTRLCAVMLLGSRWRTSRGRYSSPSGEKSGAYYHSRGGVDTTQPDVGRHRTTGIHRFSAAKDFSKIFGLPRFPRVDC